MEVRIRLAFDELFGRLQRFEHFIQTNLVKTRDIHPYLRYWLDLLGQPSEHGKTPTVLHAIWAYIDFYRYTDVQRFFKRFGYDISSFSEYPAHLRGIDPPQIVVEEGVTLDCIVPIEPGAPPKNRGTALLDEVP